MLREDSFWFLISGFRLAAIGIASGAVFMEVSH
jgi:hypothetical protein